MRPSFSTMMRSALITVESRWAMTKMVRPCIKCSIAFCTACSDSVSSAEVGSSSTRMGGFFNSARDGDALTLAAGENAAALADFGVVLFRQAQDEAVRVGGLRRVFNIGHA